MTEVPDHTAVRTALWRALHLQADAPPHVLEDDLGLKLAAPEGDWRARPDMDVEGTRLFRASIVARARFIEDLALAEAARGVGQYVILGAGLDSFALRRPAAASGLRVFEVDQPQTQAWKRRRLAETGLGLPGGLELVPVDFEAGEDWLGRLRAAGFDAGRPAVVGAAGVSMYLSREAVAALLRQAAGLEPGSVLAMTFLAPPEQASEEVRPGLQRSADGARAGGTPFRSFFTPQDMLALARDAGFAEAGHVSGGELARRYFAGRTDGLRPPERGEEMLVARAR